MPTSPAPLLVNQRDGRVVTAIEKDGHWTATDGHGCCQQRPLAVVEP